MLGVLFDILFNLHKFMRFESRDPFQEKLRRDDIHHSEWDRLLIIVIIDYIIVIVK